MRNAERKTLILRQWKVDAMWENFTIHNQHYNNFLLFDNNNVEELEQVKLVAKGM